MLGKHGDVCDVQSFGETGHVKTAYRYFIVVNDVVCGAGKLRGIVALLRFKLHANKGCFLLIAPGHKREFLGARAGINLQKKRPVSGLDRTQRNSMVFAHGSRTLMVHEPAGLRNRLKAHSYWMPSWSIPTGTRKSSRVPSLSCCN